MAMERIRVLVAIAAVGMMGAGCGGNDEPSAMPDVVGERLDVAKSDLAAAGVGEDDVEVVGGGTFGVLDESNWTVCDQDPSSGADAKNVRVIVDRVCGGEEVEALSISAATELALEDATAAGLTESETKTLVRAT